MNNQMPDCLVFKIEEYETPSGLIDNTMYVLYDCLSCRYIVRGSRRPLNPYVLPSTYSFECQYTNRLVDFIMYVISFDAKVNETLFNCKTLPSDVNDITFEMLREADRTRDEIVGYDDVVFTSVRLTKNLKILQNVFNDY